MSVASSIPDRLELLLKLVFKYAYSESESSAVFPAHVFPRLPEIAESVARLSEIYTRRRDLLSKSILDTKKLRQAYLTYFLPVNLLKLRSILNEIWCHPMRLDFLPPDLRVLDLGCGPGTHSLGFLDFAVDSDVRIRSLEIVAVDRLGANLCDTQSLFARYAAQLRQAGWSATCRLHTHEADLTRPMELYGEHAFDFVVFGNVINELFLGEKDRPIRCSVLIASVVAKWLAPHGFVILIEPALRETSRDLLQLRDHLLATTDLKVYSPCVHNLSCPALRSSNGADWCHEDRAWTSHEILRRIDGLAGNRKDSLKFSYVVLSKMGLSIKDAVPPPVELQSNREMNSVQEGCEPEVWRVVSELLKERGKSLAFLCGAPGRWKVTRLDKHASLENQTFDNLERGQIVMTSNLKLRNPTEMRIESDTRLDCVLKPSNQNKKS